MVHLERIEGLEKNLDRFICENQLLNDKINYMYNLLFIGLFKKIIVEDVIADKTFLK